MNIQIYINTYYTIYKERGDYNYNEVLSQIRIKIFIIYCSCNNYSINTSRIVNNSTKKIIAFKYYH
jgi:hypothetical protein